jgi:hypothetical protein
LRLPLLTNDGVACCPIDQPMNVGAGR